MVLNVVADVVLVYCLEFGLLNCHHHILLFAAVWAVFCVSKNNKCQQSCPQHQYTETKHAPANSKYLLQGSTKYMYEITKKRTALKNELFIF